MRFVCAVCIAAACGRVAAAQAVKSPSSTRCAGQRIDSIFIRPSAPTAAVLRSVPVAASAVRAIHTTTQPELIQNYLLLHVGDPCSELRRAESERILRSQPFIASASVLVLPDAHGGVFLNVLTTDEISAVAGATIATTGTGIRYLQLGDANIDGEGIYLAGDWRDGGAFRDEVGGRLTVNQLFGNPFVFTAQGQRQSLGGNWQLDATDPFYSDIQRTAWLARDGAHDDYVQFATNDSTAHTLHVSRRYFDVGGIFRVGPPGRLGLFGGTLSGDIVRPSADPLLVTPHGLLSDSGSALLGRYDPHRAIRLNALLGFRKIDFVRVQGFDALTATQDLPTGVQVGTMVGRSMSFLGLRDQDVFTAGDVYAGAATRTHGVRAQFSAEARHDLVTGEWDGMLTNGRVVDYSKFSDANTGTVSVEWSAGWRELVPFDFTLSDPIGGVRGYSSSNTPGGQRGVIRLEDREFLGRPRGVADFGIGGFIDAGRLWAGDIPYGVTTPVRGSAGFSILAAVPPSSARLWRMDLVMAANPEARGPRFELRLSATDKTTFFLPEPNDVDATREKTVPASVFRWPR